VGLFIGILSHILLRFPRLTLFVKQANVLFLPVAASGSHRRFLKGIALKAKTSHWAGLLKSQVIWSIFLYLALQAAIYPSPTDLNFFLIEARTDDAMTRLVLYLAQVLLSSGKIDKTPGDIRRLIR